MNGLHVALAIFVTVLFSAILGFAPARLLEPLSSPTEAEAPRVVLR